jgi:hypothetical protein
LHHIDNYIITYAHTNNTLHAPHSPVPGDDDGASASAADQQQPKPPQQQQQPLSIIAQKAYDRYGVLDHCTLDLLVRGFFITREDAAALPGRITPDGRPEVSPLHSSHYERAPRSHVDHGGGGGPGTVAHVTPRRTSLPSASVSAPAARASRGRQHSYDDISAMSWSDHSKWSDSETALIIKMRAERIHFKFIAVSLCPMGSFLITSPTPFLPQEYLSTYVVFQKN